MQTLPAIEEYYEVCSVCGMWQPDGLNIELQLQLVTWGQCQQCGGWAHLNFCSSVRELTDEEEFRGPRCENEQ